MKKYFFCFLIFYACINIFSGCSIYEAYHPKYKRPSPTEREYLNHCLTEYNYRYPIALDSVYKGKLLHKMPESFKEKYGAVILSILDLSCPDRSLPLAFVESEGVIYWLGIYYDHKIRQIETTSPKAKIMGYSMGQKIVEDSVWHHPNSLVGDSILVDQLWLGDNWRAFVAADSTIREFWCNKRGVARFRK